MDVISSILMPFTAIILVSFGTSFDDSREKTIDALEKAVIERYADRSAQNPAIVETAFTSATIRRKLDERGIHRNSVEQALESALARGARRAVIQPTHLMFGKEYNELREIAAGYEARFEGISYGEPLLATSDDISVLLRTVSSEVPAGKKEAVVLMGHGSEHFSNFLYAATDYQAKAEGYGNIFVGTVEAYPGIEEVLAAVKKAKFRSVVLAPMMLVAGDHANNDMAGDGDDSWKSIFEANGIKARAHIRGLGEYRPIQQQYIRHIDAALERLAQSGGRAQGSHGSL